MLDGVAGRELGVGGREADFLVRFAAGAGEGVFGEGVCFAAGEGGLSGIYTVVTTLAYIISVVRCPSSAAGIRRIRTQPTILQPSAPNRKNNPQIPLTIRKQQYEHGRSPGEGTFVPVGLRTGEGAEVGYRLLLANTVSFAYLNGGMLYSYLRRWRQTCHFRAIAMSW